MNHIKKVVILGFILVMLLLAGRISYAQTGGVYDLSRHTVDGGGNTLTGGIYTMVGSVGQPEVGPPITGDDYNLTGGFLSAASGNSNSGGQAVYLPIIIRN